MASQSSELATVAAAARSYLSERRDATLGLLPQRLLAGQAADAWVAFWCACRRVDDLVDRSAKAVPGRWSDAVAAAGPAARELAAAEQFLGLDAASRLRSWYEPAWTAMIARAAWSQPPALPAYLDSARLMARVPVAVLALLAGVDPWRSQRYVEALAMSVQVGDDARDVQEDRAAGSVHMSNEEIEVHGDVVAAAGAREPLAAYLLAMALEDPPETAAGLGPAVLWHQALVAQQVRPAVGPLVVWPDAPLEAVAQAPLEVAAALRQDCAHRAAKLGVWPRAVCDAVLDRS